MSQYTEGNHKTFTLPGTLTSFEQFSRVKYNAGVLALAGATDVELVVVTRPPVTPNAPIDTLLRTSNGTTPMVAAGAVTAGADVFSAANGRVSATQATGALKVGISISAASGAGSVIEVLRRSYEA